MCVYIYIHVKFLTEKLPNVIVFFLCIYASMYMCMHIRQMAKNWASWSPVSLYASTCKHAHKPIENKLKSKTIEQITLTHTHMHACVDAHTHTHTHTRRACIQWCNLNQLVRPKRTYTHTYTYSDAENSTRPLRFSHLHQLNTNAPKHTHTHITRTYTYSDAENSTRPLSSSRLHQLDTHTLKHIHTHT